MYTNIAVSHANQTARALHTARRCARVYVSRRVTSPGPRVPDDSLHAGQAKAPLLPDYILIPTKRVYARTAVKLKMSYIGDPRERNALFGLFLLLSAWQFGGSPFTVIPLEIPLHEIHVQPRLRRREVWWTGSHLITRSH